MDDCSAIRGSLYTCYYGSCVTKVIRVIRVVIKVSIRMIRVISDVDEIGQVCVHVSCVVLSTF